MSEQTKIEWCDSTFNPWIGCTKVSPGCDHCYAERSTPARTLSVMWGPTAERRRTSVSNWALPLRWNAAHDKFFAEHGRRRRVFCASLADVFDNAVDPQWRFDLMRLIEQTPNIDWLLLTKRIGNAAAMLEQAVRAINHGRCGWTDNAFPNVWLGISVINQEEADRDIPKLLSTPAARRFLSMEPLLGPVNLTRVISSTGIWDEDLRCNVLTGDSWYSPRQDEPDTFSERIDWVIVGGESGAQARPMHPEWVRSLRDQCKTAGVPFMFKQWGEWACDAAIKNLTVKWCDWHKLDYMGNLNRDYMRPLPGDEEPLGYVARIGKKTSGRLLDGRTWDQFPEGR